MEKCFWYNEKENECRALCELQCDKKCTFRETKEEHTIRIKKYNDFIQPQINRFMEVAKKQRWGEKKMKTQLRNFLSMSQARKDLYIKELS